MKNASAKPETIDEYIAGFPENVQKILKKIRATIRRAAPAAEEAIKYQIPTFVLNGSAYESGNGSVQFPLDEPIPYDLITKIVEFKVKEIVAKGRKK